MPGFKLTPFELKMIQDGYINEEGKIIRGCLQNCNLYLSDKGVNKNGDLILAVGPRFDLLDQKSMHFVIPKKEIGMYMQVRNLTEILVYDTMVNEIVKPITTYISATAADMTQEIYAEENQATNGALVQGKLTLRERKEFATQHYINGDFDIPTKIYDAFQRAPIEFLSEKGTMSRIRLEIFNALSISSRNFSTPEEVVSFRAVTTKTMMEFMDLTESRGLSKDKFHNCLRNFDGNLEKSGEKA